MEATYQSSHMTEDRCRLTRSVFRRGVNVLRVVQIENPFQLVGQARHITKLLIMTFLVPMRRRGVMGRHLDGLAEARLGSNLEISSVRCLLIVAVAQSQRPIETFMPEFQSAIGVLGW